MALLDIISSWWIIFFIIIIFTLITIVFYYRLDKFEPEPISRIIFAFFLGIVSIIPALIVELIVLYTLNTDNSFVMTVITAPIVEEFSKAFFLLYLSRNESFDGPLDGLIYGAMVGAGFSAGENLLYGINFSSVSGLGYGIFLTTVRSVAQIISHPLYTGLVGAGVGEVKVGLNRNNYSQIGRAILLHAMWNFSSELTLLGFLLGLALVSSTSIIVLRNELKLALKIDKFMFDIGYYYRKSEFKHKPWPMINWAQVEQVR